MIEYLQSWTTNEKPLRLQSLQGHTSKFRKSPVRRNLWKANYDNTFPLIQIWHLLYWNGRSNWSRPIIILQWTIVFSPCEQRRVTKILWLLSDRSPSAFLFPFTFRLGMEHSSLDLSIVKKEPGFEEPFSSDSGIFDNMMSDDFHDTNFHSMVSADFIHY